MDKRTHALLIAALATGTSYGQDLRSGSIDNLNLSGAWVDTTPPGATETATWNASSSLTNTLGANLTWGGLNVSAASGAVSISGGNTFAAGALNLGANNLSLTTSTANNSLNLSSLTGTGNLTLSNGTANLGAAAFNTANALNFNGTLTLRGGNAATTPAAVGGSFFYLGRTGITQAAGTAFALDTGAAAGNAKDVILDGGAWGGQTIHLSSLSGFGSIRRDSGAGATLATLEVNQATDTVFNGMLLSHTGTNNTDIRRLSFTKSGVGSLTLAGIVGKQTQSGGSNASDIDLTVSGGTLVLTAANTRTGLTTVASGATLQAGNGGTSGVIGGGTITNDGSLVFNYGTGAVITAGNAISGSGTIAKRGAGTLVLSGALTMTGNTTVEAGTLRVAGDLGSSGVIVASGGSLAVGSVATPGVGFAKAATLQGGSSSTFRVGFAFDQLVLDDPDGLAVSGPHVINVVPGTGLVPGDKVAIIDYSGSFSGFSNLSLAPGTRFSLVHNLVDTSVELQYTGGTLTWKGGTGTWDLDTTANWQLGASPTKFLAGDAVLFDDTATTGNVTLSGTLSPSGITIDNTNLAYTLSGGIIAGSGDFLKQGTGSATVAASTSYSGPTLVDAGTLTFGDGATSGEIGSGAVTVIEGATLRIHRSDLLDYKTNARMRNVSGGGDIVLDGGGTLFNYPGTGVGFTEANSWAGFSGTLTVKGDSEFRTIRNGATAMGTGSIVLGDATTGGRLAQIEGNWTWTNNITLTGIDNRIINRSATAPRIMKLQGVISGSGGLTFVDAAASMTNNQTGFILTGENTLNGSLNIPAGVPVRVGGVPGNMDTTQNGGGAAGTLGSATVTNEGTLTFSRTDAHTVANAIDGAGQVFVGLTTGTATQVLSFTGSKSYTGSTTVRSGTLLVNGTLPSSPVTVESTGTLGGTGTLGATTTVSGTLAPGAGVGSLTSTAGVTLANGSHIAWEISDWNGTAGTSYDTFSAASLTVNAAAPTPAVVVITPSSLVNFTEETKTFTLATTTGGITGLDAGDITVDASAFTGVGTWTVQANGNLLQLTYHPATGSPYSNWETANGIAGAGGSADSDADGIPNGIEFVIGGDPSGPNSVSSSLLPVATLDATNLTFVYRRTDDSVSFAPRVRYGSSLSGWTTAQDGVNGVVITEENNFYNASTDRVTVVIPRSLASGFKLFARLEIEIP